MSRRHEDASLRKHNDPENNNSDDDDDDEDLAWDVTKSTQTAWSAAMIQPSAIQRTRRAFGSQSRQQPNNSQFFQSSSMAATSSTGAAAFGATAASGFDMQEPPSLHASSSSFSSTTSTATTNTSPLDFGADSATAFLKPRRRSSSAGLLLNHGRDEHAAAALFFSEPPLPEEPLPGQENHYPVGPAPAPGASRKHQPMARAHTLPAAPSFEAASSSRKTAPPKPSRRRIRRSHSMALGSSSPCALYMDMGGGADGSGGSALRRRLLSDLPTASSSLHELQSESSSRGRTASCVLFDNHGSENCGPNNHAHQEDQEEIMEENFNSFSSKGRHKMARHASMQSFRPLVVVGEFARTRDSHNDLGWQKQQSAADGVAVANVGGGGGGGGDLSELVFGAIGAASSPAPSVCSSSRKRGVCGSPISDTLDADCCGWSTGTTSRSMNNNNTSSSLSVRPSRSRSRIYSSSHTSSHSNSNSNMNNCSSNSLSSSSLQQFYGSSNNNMGLPLGDDDCRGMEVDSDGDNTTSDVDTSHDQSITSATGGSESHHHHHAYPVVTIPTNHDDKQEHEVENEEEAQTNRLLQQMSSFDDLKFVIKELRQESKPCNRISDSWRVNCPPEWSTQRRSAFFQWLVRHLEFSIVSLGNSVNALRISKVKGFILLQRLEAAFETRKTQQQQETVKESQQQQQHNETEPNNGAFSFLTDVAGSSVHKQSTLGPSPFVSSLHPVSHFDVMHQSDADNLASGLQSLTVNDTNTRTLRESDASIPISVLTDPLGAMYDHHHHHHDGGDNGRPSFEHSVLDGRDMMYHMGGGGPDSPGHDVRPPKLSMASTVSSGATFRGRCSNMSAYESVAPTHTMHHCETPQIKQDEGWGSRPVAGRDWGSSCACDAGTIQALEEFFEESQRLEKKDGKKEQIDSMENAALPFMPPCQEFEFKRRPSEGRGSLASMQAVDEEPEELVHNSDHQEKLARKKISSFAKHKRVSMYTSAAPDAVAIFPERKTMFKLRGACALAPVEEALTGSLFNLDVEFPARRGSATWDMVDESDDPSTSAIHDERILSPIFGFLQQNELLCTASLVCTSWANAATTAHANMMMTSIGCDDGVENDVDDIEGNGNSQANSVCLALAKDWKYLTALYPWGCYLSSGTFKRVFKVHNTKVGGIEAVSVMDMEAVRDKKVVAAELVVSVLLSSLSRRGVCPNFVLTRGVFTSGYAPPESHWGSEENKKPKGAIYNAKKAGRPGKPRGAPVLGRYQLIRMELCNGGDLEEYLKIQADKVLECNSSRAALFQIAFALHAGADRFSLKHYDMKLLNIFVQKLEASSGDVVLRYGLGAHVFALRMHWDKAFIAKLADYGTANVRSETNGQPVTIAQFTTLENTPPDFMILGDLATQGHGHDNWGLGLCMLHLFTGHMPYEEIMVDVTCPPMLRKKLKKIWENDQILGFSAIRSVVLADVYKDDNGHIIDGEPDETLYQTLYRYLVLFGVPKENFQDKERPQVWKAIRESLESTVCRKTGRVRKQGTDVDQFQRDRMLYSIERGGNNYIRDARARLQQMEGGMDLLFSLCAFDPARRATALQVLNSPFMKPLREDPNVTYGANDHVQSFTAFSTNC